jgi:hypothetical protein
VVLALSAVLAVTFERFPGQETVPPPLETDADPGIEGDGSLVKAIWDHVRPFFPDEDFRTEMGARSHEGRVYRLTERACSPRLVWCFTITGAGTGDVVF